MKQKLPILLIALTTAAGAHAFSYTYGGQTLNYEATSATTCMLVSYEANASNGDYVIPEKVTNDGNEYTVTKIAEDAFKNYDGLTSLEIPESVTSIGKNAFFFCNNLESVNIPQKVNTIQKYTFFYCNSLKSISIPKGVTTIEDCAFQHCVTLTSIEIPESVTSIGEHAFNECTGLASVVIPESVVSLAMNVFNGCSGLISVELPNSITSIPANTFRDCSSLSSIVIPGSVTSIGGYAFWKCTSLTSVEIPNSVTSIGGNAFMECSSLGSVVIPESVTSMDDWVFSYCTGLTSIKLPESLTSIPDKTFKNCTGLTSIEIPESVTSIGQSAFDGCTGLTSIEIPESVTTIGGSAFAVSSYDTKLESITVHNPDPSKITLGSYVFSGVNNYRCVLYVPNGSQELYANARQWSSFKNILNIPYQVDLVDGEAYDNDVDSYKVDVTYTRTYTNTSWQALYLPFDMEYADWADLGDIAKLNNVHQYDTDGDGKLDKTTLEFNLVTDTIAANTPYVFRPKEVGELTFRVSEATLKAAPATDAFIDCSSTENVYTIYGTYSVKEGLYDQGAYALSPAGQFVKAATPKQTLKPYRIYMIITDKNYGSSSQQAPARISVTVDGEAAGIDDIEILQQIDDRYYDLMGRPVENPQTGIYIRGGEKVYVK